MDFGNNMNKEHEKKFDEQWNETDHYIIWGEWVKDAIKKILKAQRKEDIKVVERFWKKYSEARIEGKDAGAEAYKFKEDILKEFKNL